jgi:hypothetical protein
MSYDGSAQPRLVRTVFDLAPYRDLTPDFYMTGLGGLLCRQATST